MPAQAFIFDGSSLTQIDFGSDVGDSYGAFTIAIWMKLSATSGRDGVWHWKSATSGTNMPRFGCVKIDGVLDFYGVNASGNVIGGTGGVTVTSTDWQLLVCRFDTATNDMKLTWEGTTVGVTDTDTWPQGGLRYFALGEWTNDPIDLTYENLNGKIAHVAIWDAYLTDGNVTSLAGGDNPTTVASSDLQFYWYDSKTAHTGTGTFTDHRGTVTLSGADLPTVDDPLGGASAVPLLMQMYHGG